MTEPDPRLSERVLLRYLYADGSVQGAFPMRVVEERNGLLVAWLAPDSQIRYWAMADGADPRSVPLEQRYRRPMTSAPRRWYGPGVLHVVPFGRQFQVVHFWHDDATFAGWYINLEESAVRTGALIDAIDWQLDVWIDPSGSASWKDEDEAAAAVTAGVLAPDDLRQARETGLWVIDNFDAVLAEIGDWRQFRPLAEWGPLELPGDWAQS